MKKILVSMIIIFCFALVVVFAQAQEQEVDPAENVAADENQQAAGVEEQAGTEEQEGTAGAQNGGFVTEAITNYTIDTFEAANTWNASIPRDFGVATLMRREGYAADVREANPDASKYILALKIEFFKTGNIGFAIEPPRRIRIPGTVKDLSVWVAGRNYEHSMSFYISDADGNTHSIGNNKLNFIGWKKISSYISPTIMQETIHNQDSGIDFLGIRIDCDPSQTRGKYFVYFDDLTATTDLYLSTYASEDDPKDTW